MGCILEMIVEIFLEGMLELLGYGYIKLMSLILPQKEVNPHVQEKIKNVLTVISVLLLLVLVVGVGMCLPGNDEIFRSIGKYMVNIPLIWIGIQVTLGIGFKIYLGIKNQKQPQHEKTEK